MDYVCFNTFVVLFLFREWSLINLFKCMTLIKFLLLVFFFFFLGGGGGWSSTHKEERGDLYLKKLGCKVF